MTADRAVEAKTLTRRLLLASRSPRRRKLLSEHGFAHEVIESGVDDSCLAPGRVSAEQWVLALAHLKARAGLASLAVSDGAADGVLLAADTVVVKGDELIGQPRDASDARRIIRTLSNGEHRVLTGVAIASGDDVRWLLDAAEVRVGDIGDARIDKYVDSGDWRGKAGGYNLAERLEAGWPIEFVGDATSIMGLPMQRLAPMLTELLGGVEAPGVQTGSGAGSGEGA